MLTINVINPKNQSTSIQVNIPTELKEITNEYLEGITNNINVAEHHALIALCYREKLSTLALAYRSKKTETQAAVVPIFVKAGITDSKFVNNISCGDVLIIGGSDIALGYHVNSPKNQLTLERIMGVLEADKSSYSNLISKQDYCYFVEFKLVPINVIHGSYNKNENVYNPSFIIGYNPNA